MKKIIIFLFSFLLACNTSSKQTAYNDYYKYQQLYINALLNNDKTSQLNALKEIIKCGEYLEIDTKEYKKRYNILKKNSHFSKKYIKILSFNPIKIKIPSTIKVFSLKNKKGYKKVIDIKNAIISKSVTKHIGKFLIRIAQFNKQTVRLVIHSKKVFDLKYKIKNSILYVYLPEILPKKQKRKKIIVIDPGHGGKDVGGVIGKRYEKTVVLKVAKKLAKLLKKEGYIVYLTRKGDYFIPLKKRTHFANLKKADLFISLHCNIAPRNLKSPHGIETYYLSPTRNERAIRVARTENKSIQGLNYLDQRVILNFLNKDRIVASQKFGIDVQKNIINTLKRRYSNIKDGRIRPAPFWVLVGTQMPAILIEMGYMTNPLELKRLFNPHYQYYLAKGIEKGIKEYFKRNK